MNGSADACSVRPVTCSVQRSVQRRLQLVYGVSRVASRVVDCPRLTAACVGLIASEIFLVMCVCEIEQTFALSSIFGYNTVLILIYVLLLLYTVIALLNFTVDIQLKYSIDICFACIMISNQNIFSHDGR